MVLIKIFVFLLLGVFGAGDLLAKNFYDYLLRQPLSLEILAQKHFSRPREVKYKSLENYVEQLKKWNPHIAPENYKEIPIGTEVYLDIPYSPYIPNLSYADDLMLGYEREKANYYSMDLGVGVFQRRLSQNVSNNDLKLEAVQRSPISLNSSFFMAPRKSRYQLGVNFKLSHLLPSTSNANKEFPATREYSFTPFWSYLLLKEYKIKAKLGARYQRFVTFNLEEVSQGREIEMFKYDIGYLTGGLSWSYKIFGLYSTLGLTYSSSLWSQNNRQEGDPSFSSHVIQIENSYEVEKIIYTVFYELESSKIGGVNSELTRFGGSVRFYLF